jgi:CheY-like chemotaxis protein
LLRSESYDVVVLDRGLPKVHGDRVCRKLVDRGSPSRVLMLTAADAIEDLVDGLVSAPATTSRSCSRSPSWSPESGRSPGRTRPAAVSPILEAGDIRLDTVRRFASRAGRRLELNGGYG